jgi:hypothetical protein
MHERRTLDRMERYGTVDFFSLQLAGEGAVAARIVMED